jgi:hypothetical protein
MRGLGFISQAGALRMADGPEPADLGLIKPLVEGNTEVRQPSETPLAPGHSAGDASTE